MVDRCPTTRSCPSFQLRKLLQGGSKRNLRPARYFSGADEDLSKQVSYTSMSVLIKRVREKLVCNLSVAIEQVESIVLSLQRIVSVFTNLDGHGPKTCFEDIFKRCLFPSKSFIRRAIVNLTN